MSPCPLSQALSFLFENSVLPMCVIWSSRLGNAEMAADGLANSVGLSSQIFIPYYLIPYVYLLQNISISALKIRSKISVFRRLLLHVLVPWLSE